MPHNYRVTTRANVTNFKWVAITRCCLGAGLCDINDLLVSCGPSSGCELCVKWNVQIVKSAQVAMKLAACLRRAQRSVAGSLRGLTL